MITICTPVYGNPETASVSLEYVKAWKRMPQDRFPTVHYTNCDLVRARSRGVRMALDHGASHLLFWDSDVGGDDAPRILQGMVGSNVDLIAAPYARKNRTAGPTHSNDGGHVAMGFTLLSHACMARMVEAYASTLTFGDQVDGKVIPTVALFQLMLAHGTMLGEDFSFCERWKQIGGSVYLYEEPGLKLSHVGATIY